ncbi:MAG: segregation and condensation protein A [Acidimicrobiales bacterium]
MGYRVCTDVFEGPFDVLLRLITEQRVDLYEVRLSDIVDAYLAEIDAMERVNLEVATEFLLIAAILVELKSRRLLPDKDASISDEDLALLEERDYLLARLVECTTFSAAGQAIVELERLASDSIPRQSGPDESFERLVPDILAGVTAADILEAARRALAERPRPAVHVEHILVDEVTVAEVVQRLASYLAFSPPTTFRELTKNARSRTEVVVHFLGLLELYKQGLVELDQGELFGQMTVVWTGDQSAEEVGQLLVDVEYGG